MQQIHGQRISEREVLIVRLLEEHSRSHGEASEHAHAAVGHQPDHDSAGVGKLPGVEDAIKDCQNMIKSIKDLGSSQDGQSDIMKQNVSEQGVNLYSTIKNRDYAKLAKDLEEHKNSVPHHRARRMMKLCFEMDHFFAFLDKVIKTPETKDSASLKTWMNKCRGHLWDGRKKLIGQAKEIVKDLHIEEMSPRLIPSLRKQSHDKRIEDDELHKEIIYLWLQCQNVEILLKKKYDQHTINGRFDKPSFCHDQKPEKKAYGLMKEIKTIGHKTTKLVCVMKKMSDNRNVIRAYELAQNFDVLLEKYERLGCAGDYYRARCTWGMSYTQSIFDAGRTAEYNVPPSGFYLIVQSSLIVDRDRVELLEERQKKHLATPWMSRVMNRLNYLGIE